MIKLFKGNTKIVLSTLIIFYIFLLIVKLRGRINHCQPNMEETVEKWKFTSISLFLKNGLSQRFYCQSHQRQDEKDMHLLF
jgi:hypothetical protein